MNLKFVYGIKFLNLYIKKSILENNFFKLFCKQCGQILVHYLFKIKYNT